VSRQLASVVVPHEYGLDGPGKLLIGSKICAELLGKLLCDLDSMKVRDSWHCVAVESGKAAPTCRHLQASSFTTLDRLRVKAGSKSLSSLASGCSVVQLWRTLCID
jgi:hypothetical protein